MNKRLIFLSSLRYAEVYTAEEVALITRDKLIRLQSLYINQFKRLQHMLKEKRREFLFNVKKEMPIYGKLNHETWFNQNGLYNAVSWMFKCCKLSHETLFSQNGWLL